MFARIAEGSRERDRRRILPFEEVRALNEAGFAVLRVPDWSVEVARAQGEPDAVADAVRVVRDSGLPYELTSMFTTIEGEWDEVMDVVKRATGAVVK